MRRRAVTTLIAAFACVLAYGTAAHASAINVIRDCSEDGKLDRHYSQHDLSKALDKLPSDIDEYTDCRSVIRAAQLSGAHKGGGGAAASAPPSPAESKQLDQARKSPGPLEIGGKRLQPGAAGAPFAAAGLGTDLPTAVLIVLVMLALAMIAGAGFAAQRRWPEAWAHGSSAVAGTLRRIRDGVKRGISRGD